MASEIKVDTIVNAGGDNDTGIDLATNDQILLKVANATKLTMNSTGQTTIVGEGGTTTTNMQQGLCKCWIRFNGTGTIATNDSFNVSGITDEGTGNYTVTINNDMANDDYAYYGFSSRDNSASQVGMFGTTDTSLVTTGKFRISELAGSFFDVGVVMCAVHGDLA
jgi:hypothetical protein